MNPKLLRVMLFVLALPFILSLNRVTYSKQTDQPSSQVKVKGLKDLVTIRRDDRGIPYIEAKNDEDLYFAQGYATAQDRLWQMDLFRRNARGELSEVLPKVPNSPALDQDKLHRTLGFAQVVDAEVAQASPQARAILDAYAAGVNAYIASLGPKTLPPEFQILGYAPKPWTAADSLIVVKIFFEARAEVPVLSKSVHRGWRHGVDGVRADQLLNIEHIAVFRILGSGACPKQSLRLGALRAQRFPARPSE